MLAVSECTTAGIMWPLCMLLLCLRSSGSRVGSSSGLTGSKPVCCRSHSTCNRFCRGTAPCCGAQAQQRVVVAGAAAAGSSGGGDNALQATYRRVGLDSDSDSGGTAPAQPRKQQKGRAAGGKKRHAVQKQVCLRFSPSFSETFRIHVNVPGVCSVPTAALATLCCCRYG